MDERKLIGIAATTWVLALSLALYARPERPAQDSPVQESVRQSIRQDAHARRFYPGSEDLPTPPAQVRAQEGSEPGIVPAVHRTREDLLQPAPPPKPLA